MSAVGQVYLHGLESSGQATKALWMARVVPSLLRPDFTGSLAQRMAQLLPVLGAGRWRIVGSSFGGLMGALFALDHPDQVEGLILLAPALHHPEFPRTRSCPVPTLLIHGRSDEVVPPELVEEVALTTFPNLTVWPVEDDHRLTGSYRLVNWAALLDVSRPPSWSELAPP